MVLYDGECALTKYTDIKKIGEGTYGTVYRARHVKDNTIVALKKIRQGEDGVPSTCIREIFILKQFVHPNIVRILDVIVHREKRLHIVSEHVDQDLKMMMEKIVPRPLPLTVIKMSQTSLSDIHEVLTLWCRAPKILLGARFYSPAVDVWSLACIFAEMILGNALFAGDSEIDQLFRVFQLLGTPTSTVWSDVDRMPAFHVEFPKWKRRSLSISVPGLGKDGVDLIEVLTLWCRAPKILLGARFYSPAVDVWSLACIFAEMVLGNALFAGDSEIDQLDLRFQLLGAPTSTVWSDVDRMPAFHMEFPKWKRRCLSVSVPGLDEDGVDLIEKNSVSSSISFVEVYSSGVSATGQSSSGSPATGPPASDPPVGDASVGHPAATDPPLGRSTGDSSSAPQTKSDENKVVAGPGAIRLTRTENVAVYFQHRSSRINEIAELEFARGQIANGRLSLYITDTKFSKVDVHLKEVDHERFGFHVGPNVSGDVFQLCDVLSPLVDFPCHQENHLLNWICRYDYSSLPFQLAIHIMDVIVRNCENRMDVSVECYLIRLTSTQTSNVEVTIPIPPTYQPSEVVCDGTFRYDRIHECLTWRPSEAEATRINYRIIDAPEMAWECYPVRLSYTTQKIISDLDLQIEVMLGSTPVEYTLESSTTSSTRVDYLNPPTDDEML